MINFIKNIYNILININKMNFLVILNYDILQNICVYLKYYELIQLAKTDLKNLDLQNSIKVQYDLQKNILEKFLLNLKRYKVLKLFENTFFPMGIIKKLPILEFKDQYVGSSGYIDSIIQSNLIKPIMIGTDNFSRPFIVIKYQYNNIWHIITVFQRYTDCKQIWVKSDGYTYGPILNSSNTMVNNFYKKQFIKNVCQLINKQMVTIIDENFQLSEIKCNL